MKHIMHKENMHPSNSSLSGLQPEILTCLTKSQFLTFEQVWIVLPI